MTALELAKMAGFDHEKARSVIGKGSGECEEIEVRTFRCWPWEYGEEAVGVEIRGCVHYSDGAVRPVHSSWGKDLDVTLYFEQSKVDFQELRWIARYTENELKEATICQR